MEKDLMSYHKNIFYKAYSVPNILRKLTQFSTKKKNLYRYYYYPILQKKKLKKREIKIL